jgi:hypothetical protein
LALVFLLDASFEIDMDTTTSPLSTDTRIAASECCWLSIEHSITLNSTVKISNAVRSVNYVLAQQKVDRRVYESHGQSQEPVQLEEDARSSPSSTDAGVRRAAGLPASAHRRGNASNHGHGSSGNVTSPRKQPGVDLTDDSATERDDDQRQQQRGDDARMRAAVPRGSSSSSSSSGSGVRHPRPTSPRSAMRSTRSNTVEASNGTQQTRSTTVDVRLDESNDPTMNIKNAMTMLQSTASRESDVVDPVAKSPRRAPIRRTPEDAAKRLSLTHAGIDKLTPSSKPGIARSLVSPRNSSNNSPTVT